MAILRKLAKAGVAKRLFDEVRKPHNQQKAKDAYRKLRGRTSGSRAR